jgi:chemotaxis methyl-accepting protein methylase
MPYLHEDKNFHDLLGKIHDEHGVDLTEYRSKCLGRRIYSRLRATQIDSIAEYINYLDENPAEYKNLMDAVTINVTEFFRNAEVFHAIEKKVLPELIARKKEEGKRILRLWSAGCASGEEAYTMGIILYEFLGETINDFIVKVYGTDIDKNVLAMAVVGRYEAAALKEAPPKIVSKYFYQDQGKYVIADKVRLITKFMHHDLVKSEPLKHIDLILCRNVVIYFSRDLSSRIYAGFYQALNAKGYLILGKVEALWGEGTRYFKAVDSRERIYQKMV